MPKNIYGVTKVAAEDLCQLFWRNQKLPCLILRTSRFFPEGDDLPDRRDAFDDDNLKVNELLYRRVDIEDVVSAHLCALEKAASLGFGRFIITATTPFEPGDVAELGRDAPPCWRGACRNTRLSIQRAAGTCCRRWIACTTTGGRESCWAGSRSMTFSGRCAPSRRGARLAQPAGEHIGSKGYHHKA